MTARRHVAAASSRAMRASLWALSAFIGVAPASARATDGIDEIVRRQMRLSQLPGAAVAVIRPGRPPIVRTYGHANLEWNAATTPDTAFQLASATKIVTGIVLMRLVEQGRLSLDDPLTRWFPDAPPSWQAITIRNLANHTSGLSDELQITDPRTVPSIVAAAMRSALVYRPGTQARYGFTDFTVLRAVLEKAGGASLPALVRDEIASPLRLTSMRFAEATEEGPVRLGAVIPHRASTYGLRAGAIVTSDFFFEPAGYGAGGLYASIADLATLFAALDRGRLLTRASLRELTTPAALAGGKTGGFGVGWVTRQHRGVAVVGHSGGPALADIVRAKDRRITVIVLTNQQVFYPVLAARILDLYLKDVVDPPALVDDRPDWAARLRAVLTGKEGTADTALAAPLKSDFGQALLRAAGPLDGLDYVGQRSQGDCRSARQYRARFRWHTIAWTLVNDCEGKLTGLSPD